jgi:cyanophycin synthetase
LNAVELRTLDGPNLFMLRPAIKLEIAALPDETVTLPEALAARLSLPERSATGPVAIARLAGEVIAWIAGEVGMPVPEIAVRAMEEPGHVVVAYAWARRNAAKAVGHLAWKLVAGEQVALDPALEEIRELLATPADDEDRPEVIVDAERRIPTIGITGTNGKTTTTRLIASILRNAGNRVAWTSSSGVVVDGEMVLPGDYTGPAGAHRVFEEPGIDYAVLETARGGILLRGLGYEHSDVSVVTNISADHMGLHGVYSLEELTAVKAVVARATKLDGHVVLNADDPRVLGMREVISARPVLFSRQPEQDAVREHVAAGGWALVARDGEMTWLHDGEATAVIALADVPLTFGGRAQHMVENALAAAAACLAVGLPVDQVRDGLAKFRNRADQNRGRLNVYRLGDAVVVIDFAHNEAGLSHLLAFARGFCGEGGRVISVVGTAGDRDDAALSGIARIAGQQSDSVVIKDTTKYLRGREAGEMPAIMRPLVGSALVGEAGSEWEGFQRGLELTGPGDALAVMCIEESDRILAWLDAHGESLS